MSGMLVGFPGWGAHTKRSMTVARAAHSWASTITGELISLRQYLGPNVGGNSTASCGSNGSICRPYSSLTIGDGGRLRRLGSSRPWFLSSHYGLRQAPYLFQHAFSNQFPYKNSGFRNVRAKLQTLRSVSKGRKLPEQLKTLLSEDLKYIQWWDDKMKACRKPSTKEMTKRLKIDNLLGLDESLRNGSFKGGRMNAELLEMKRRFPHEVLLCRVGEFYEGVGFDACILVEYAGLNPMGGTRSDTVPKAGCPIMNLRQALDELTRQGFSVCIVEEVKGPSQAKGQLKERFIAGHAHPGSPYVYGLVGADVDLEFPEPVQVIGIARSARGYCLVSVLEMMRTFSVEDGLTEEAVVAKMRARQCQRLFMHRSLRGDASGLVRWGEGGLLWGECQRKPQEWYESDPVEQLLSKVRELYDLEPNEEFREIVLPSGERPRPLYVGTASQIGILHTPGVPSLLKVALPSDANSLCISYLRNLLLHPPPYQVATCIQAACRQLVEVTSSIPDLTCVSAAKLVKLIEAKEANQIEFARMLNMAEDVLYMASDPQLSHVLDCLLDPTWLATGLHIEREQLVDDCKLLAGSIGRVLARQGDPDQAVSSGAYIPEDFLRDLEDNWRGRVKREHAEEEYANVESAAAELSGALISDFLPVIHCVKGYQKPLGGGSGGRKCEICYSRENQAVWFKGKNFKPPVWGQMPGEAEMRRLAVAYDGKGKKVGEEWWTTSRVENALNDYRTAVDRASAKVVKLLRSLAEELRVKMNALIFISVLSIIAKTLCMHVSEGKRRKWVFATLSCSSNSTPQQPSYNEGDGNVLYPASLNSIGTGGHMVLVDLIPYWKDLTCERAEANTVEMASMFLLTGPNGGGKSSILRSICAAAVLAVCGFMVPAREASVPQLDAIMLRMMSTDSPADNKSSFQMEMSELRTILAEATERSLVLVDELCRGTEVQKGTYIAASVIETLDRIGCLGVLSTHLHDLLDMELQTSKVVRKAMGTKDIDGQLEPTWKLVDGSCRESLAFQVARKEGVPESVVQRAEELYRARWKYSRSNTRLNLGGESDRISSLESGAAAEVVQMNGSSTTGGILALDSQDGMLGGGSGCTSSLRNEVPPVRVSKPQPQRDLRDVMAIYNNVCKLKLFESHESHIETGALPVPTIACSLVGPRQLPPPATTNHSCVYMLQRPDGKFYVGQSDNLTGRIRQHRMNFQLREVPFLYLIVANKSVACELETTLINQLPSWGLVLVNKSDQNHRYFGTAPLIEAPPF